MQDKPSIIISLHQDIAYEVDKQIEKAVKLGYHSITVSPVHWKYDREFEEEPRKTKHVQFSRPDLVLSSPQWLGQTICRLNSTVDLDSPTDHVRRHGERVIRQELSFAEHLVQNGYIMLPLKSGNCVNLARTVTSVPVKEMLLLEVPMVNPKLAQNMWRTDRTEDHKKGEEEEDTWHWWNRFRTYADYNPTIKLALELSADIPPKAEVYRWLGEPVDCIVLPSTLFISNASNYPVLSRAHQELLVLFYRTFECHFIVKANPSDGRLANYADYIKHILRSNYVKDPMQGYDDLLENPLQPLHENLDNFTYEIFEKDPVKYILYQNAIEQALIDRVPDDAVATQKSIIMVVGGGRGPLVRAALNASMKSKRQVKVYVIEKNPNAIVTLSALIKTIWKGRDVELIATDMREFHPPEKADILVSELLGSFGDNELSPECLDGAQEHLKPNGISIPCKSTSYVNPCLATKLHNQIRALEKCPHTKDRIASSRNMESSYVAYQRNVYHIANPQAVFEFVHPNHTSPIDNSRFKTLRFKASLDCVMNGFTGYFDTVLYKDIVLSIHPFTHTRGMASWFSLFFPLTEPIQVRKDEEIIVNFWRCVSSHKVWYEWCLTAPKLTHVHNVQGRGQSIWK